MLTTSRLQAAAPRDDVAARLLDEFQRAAEHVPAYRVLLAQSGVRAVDVRDLWSFSALCPILSKDNTFDRFPLPHLCVGGRLRDVGEVLTSSGHGGRFSFGVISRAEAEASGAFADAALDAAFQVRSRTTLAINCLPMGVVVSSQCMTVATTSVREDMAVALAETFGSGFDQLVLIGDPLFMKRLTDYAAERALDWSRFRVNAVIGEETFGDHFRRYLGSCLGLDPTRPGSGYVMSSFGVAELGLHLSFETPETLALSRAAAADPALAGRLLGAAPGAWRPMILAFDPGRTFIEIADPDEQGYGRLTISMLDPARQIPLLRYQTGDVAKLLDGERPLLALRGRAGDTLPNGANVGQYKDVLYADPELARSFTGATRLVFSDACFTMHVQLVRGEQPTAAVESSLLGALPAEARPSRVVLWPYAQFPFGMGLDYERKFSYYVPDGPAAAV